MYADLIFPFSLAQVFTYKIPVEFQQDVKPGIRVVVQFGSRKIYSALVHKVHNHPPQGFEIKEILSVLDSGPVVNSFQFEFWKWISEYYMCTMGEVMKASLPAGLKLESETRLIFNPEFQDFSAISEKESTILSVLEKRNTLTINDIAKFYNKRDLLSIIKLLIEKEAIYAEEYLHEGKKPKLEVYIRLSSGFQTDENLNEAFQNLKRAPRQVELLNTFLHLSGFGSETPVNIKKQLLLKETGSSGDTLQSLIKKGILEIFYQEVFPRVGNSENEYSLKTLNTAQQEALENIRKLFVSQNVILLYGVTSSGKTEIYFHLIAEELRKGNQVLYLLPEIALTAQMIDRLTDTFGDCIGVYHSKYSDTERTAIWQELLKPADESRYKILLGVRSSVLLPFSRLGLIIVDEEHENTFKQFDPAPRYHARDSAIVLASLHHAKVLLGSATPSMETYSNVLSGKFGMVRLDSRFLDMAMPATEIVDVRRARKKKQMQSHFHPVMLEHIQQALTTGEQVILFQNRRGFAPYMQCSDCGDIPRCKHCDVSLTYHKGINQLTCHYCGYSTSSIGHCRSCGSSALKVMGFGTEKIEEEIELFIPGARVARLDMDTTRSRRAYEKLISDFDSGNIDILVGTQMVTKGLDFKNVSLVGILDADHLLNYPDFRAYERSYQLMAQVSGRAGRRNKQGKVIIQTTMPEHPIILNVVGNQFEAIYNSQLLERKNFLYPPYCRLIQIIARHRDASFLSGAADALTAKLRTHFREKVFGPEFMLIPRMQNLYQKQILIKIPRNSNLQEWKSMIALELKNMQQWPDYKTVQLSVDVDPM